MIKISSLLTLNVIRDWLKEQDTATTLRFAVAIDNVIEDEGVIPLVSAENPDQPANNQNNLPKSLYDAIDDGPQLAYCRLGSEHTSKVVVLGKLVGRASCLNGNTWWYLWRFENHFGPNIPERAENLYHLSHSINFESVRPSTGSITDWDWAVWNDIKVARRNSLYVRSCCEIWDRTPPLGDTKH